MLRAIILCISVLGATFIVAQNNSKNIDLKYNWLSSDTNVTEYNDCWGYESNGREYAIIGSNWGTHFLEVSDSLTSAREINSFIGRANDVTWRDFKTYSHYAYGVADGDSNSLQIFDLQYLPDSVVKVFDDNSISESSHNIFIESDRLYFCSNQIGKNKSNQALDVYSLANPSNPVHLKSFPNSTFDDYALHDLYVRDNIAFCSAGYGGLHIYDLSDLENPILKAKLDIYPEQGYNHSSWLSNDGTKLVVADEVPSSLDLKLFDVSNFDNIEFLDIFHSNDLATPHNPFFKDDKIVVSYYLDGVQIFDYSNIYKVSRVAYYDTYPDDTSYYDWGAYGGCWGTYPFLPSNNILASDRTYGLHVLDVDYDAFTKVENQIVIKHATVYPNPIINDELYVNSDLEIEKYIVFNNLGQIISTKEEFNKSKISIDTKNLDSGNYLIAIYYQNNGFETLKFKK